jgi:hypothetical protein
MCNRQLGVNKSLHSETPLNSTANPLLSDVAAGVKTLGLEE